MGRRDKQKKFEFKDEDDIQSGNYGASKSVNSPSSDDDEANEDLSLKIVEKALLLRSGKLVSAAGDSKDCSHERSGNGGVGADEVFSSSLEGANDVSGTSRASADGITAASEVPELGSKKTVKKRKKKVKKLGSEERDMVVTEEQKIETTGMVDQIDTVEPNSTEATDNNVFRKLLRGPRYFDPPDSWGTCYNCGEEGHNAVNCKSAKRKKPCFVCGSLEHNARSCGKARDCYICKKVGHRAKDCPEKRRDTSSSSTICLKCGDPGHDMFSCRNLYPDNDLKNIQCYICMEFGHLCCGKSTTVTSVDISCYKCGQTGHTGLACLRLRGDVSAAVSHSSCYRCGEEGHFARECTSSIKSGKGILEEASGGASTSSCYKCGEQGHFARECNSSNKGGKRNRELSNPKLRSQIEETNHTGSKSVSHDLAKAHSKKKKINHEETYTNSPRKSGQKGRWMMEDPSPYNYSHGKFMRNNWNSPVTPSRWDRNYYSEYTDHYVSPQFSGHYASPRSSSHYASPRSFTKDRKLRPETPMSLGSSKASQNRFSKSRFGGLSNEGRRKSYEWW